MDGIRGRSGGKEWGKEVRLQDQSDSVRASCSERLGDVTVRHVLIKSSVFHLHFILSTICLRYSVKEAFLYTVR